MGSCNGYCMVEDAYLFQSSLTTTATTTGYNSQHRIDDEDCSIIFYPTDIKATLKALNITKQD
ncbi:hypothetical protein C4D60_Mb10t00390 [Musa balbisiana]|uniref:Uncharacterized protein n=1 Tax=Musa balbisiana TaxID=52838 RepID=A0A4S8ITR4_MUSBA|nr:hypothetical protein C4D60_Mb10t00390 [Musa balbisiana]